MGAVDLKVLRSVAALVVDGKAVRPQSHKAEAMLLYMFLSNETSFRRNFLASLFWEEHDMSMARDNLRQVIVKIKKKCTELTPVLTIGRSIIEVDCTVVRLDVEELLEDPASFFANTDLDLTNFDLGAPFSHFEDIGSSFGSWIRVYQSSLERRITSRLHEVLQDDEQLPDVAFKAAMFMQKLDPTDEISCRFLMRHYATHGRPGEAIKVYNSLYELLDDSYDVEPSDETIALNANIKLGEVGPPEAREKAISDLSQSDQSIPEVFVAEFDMPEEDLRTLRLGRFFRAEVLSNLSKFREWHVVGSEPQSQTHYRLDCIIQDHDEEIDTILSLKSAQHGRILWSQRIVVGFDNWRDTQWRIAQQVALAIDQTLTTDRLRSTLNERPQDRSDFDKWTICASLNAEWSPDSADQMDQLLKEILKSSPRFGLAHVYLAAAYNKRHLVYPGVFRDENAVKAALHHGRLAMEIDTLDSQSHRVFAWAKALNGEFDVAEFHFQQSYDLNPANLHVRASAALGFAFADNLEKACEIADATIKLSPSIHPFHWGYFQNIYFLADRLTDARMAGDHAGSAISNLPAWQSAILRELGDPERAAIERDRFLSATRRRWQGRGDPSDHQVFDWFLQCFPLRNVAQKKRLAKNLMPNAAIA